MKPAVKRALWVLLYEGHTSLGGNQETRRRRRAYARLVAAWNKWKVNV